MLDPDTPDSRAYVHRACGGTTVVSGADFEKLSDPFRMITGTFCARCGRMVGLREVFWADTEEAVGEARDRWRTDCPPAVRRLNAPLGCWLSLVLGGLGGAALGCAMVQVEWPRRFAPIILFTTIGVIAVPMLWCAVVAPYLTRRVLKHDWRRMR
jgi:hypothetical protein